jgi:hypothetical protein
MITHHRTARRFLTRRDVLSMAMVLPVYNQYQPRYSPNLQARHIPDDYADAGRYFDAMKNG